MGKKRSTSPRRIAETLIRINPDVFTTDYEANKKLVKGMTDLHKVMRNRVAGYVTRLKKTDKIR